MLTSLTLSEVASGRGGSEQSENVRQAETTPTAFPSQRALAGGWGWRGLNKVIAAAPGEWQAVPPNRTESSDHRTAENPTSATCI